MSSHNICTVKNLLTLSIFLVEYLGVDVPGGEAVGGVEGEEEVGRGGEEAGAPVLPPRPVLQHHVHPRTPRARLHHHQVPTTRPTSRQGVI